MKIKIDHVTNSSSEVFGVVLADSAVAAGLVFMLDAVSNTIRMSGPAQQIDELQSERILDAEKIASRVTEGVLEDARTQEKIVKDAYTDALSTLNTATSGLQTEISKIKKDWEAYDKGADKMSSDYQVRKDKDDAYLEYLNFQLKQTESQKKALLEDRSEKFALINDRDAWIQQNQADYITIQEQKALLRSLYESDPNTQDAKALWMDCFSELERRELDLDKTLMSVNAKCEYQALARGKIELNNETKEKMLQLNEAKKAFESELETADAASKAKLQSAYNKKTTKLREEILAAQRFEMANKASEGLQYGADVAISGLVEIAGPAGAQIKIAYTAAKTLVLGIKEAKKDPKHRAKLLAKAILNSSTIVLKDQLVDQPWAKDATTLLNTTLQASLDASIAGHSIPESIGTSLTKGIFDLGANQGIAALKEATASSSPMVEPALLTPQEILNDNPLTQKLSESFNTKITFV